MLDGFVLSLMSSERLKLQIREKMVCAMRWVPRGLGEDKMPSGCGGKALEKRGTALGPRPGLQVGDEANARKFWTSVGRVAEHHLLAGVLPVTYATRPSARVNRNEAMAEVLAV